MESKRDVARMDWRLIGALIGVIGLGRAALGLQQYPYGDDMVYGPLARLAADPTLYANDEQLRSFENHAWVYGLIWRAAEATVGVVAAHLVLTVGLTVLIGLTMLWIARAVGASGWFAPLGFVLAHVVTLGGVGRGAYGGAVGQHFHLQSLAIALSLLVFLAVLRQRWVWAGAALGAAALSHPVLAFHAAFAVSCLLLGQGRGGFRPLVIVAGVSIIVAAPLLVTLLGVGFSSEMDAERVIRDGYRWRVDNHYRLPASEYLIFALYAALGLFAALRLRMGAGAIIGLSLLGVLSWVFYSGGLGFEYVSILPYKLDLTRSSPLLWVLATALAAAAAEDAWRRRDMASLTILGAMAALILALNFLWSVYTLAALAAAALAATRLIDRRFVATGLATLGAVAVIIAVAAIQNPLDRDARMRGFYEWARDDTPKDAMFIAPPFIADIREFARRPVWVDFRAVSMAQVGQIMLSRARHEQITPGHERLPGIGGWRGARLWTQAYSDNHDAQSIAEVLRRTGADYLVIYRPERPYETAGAGLKIAYADEHAVVLELREP